MKLSNFNYELINKKLKPNSEELRHENCNKLIFSVTAAAAKNFKLRRQNDEISR